ncbi:hypothetical protein C4559_01730 [Candidatus Microgenomates bacterium]|nr:MAG: hypothetical protein C4559_01730 [Candidatus Microgenomates bacterium]
MTTIHQKKQDDNKNTIGSVGAGIAIAGVAVATTIALKDEKTRKKVKNVLVNVKDQTIDLVEILKIKPNIGEGFNTIKKITTDTKKAVEENI